MRTIDAIGEMKAASRAARAKEKKIGFIPTMGALHEGHLSLVRLAKRLSDQVVLSVFVNPTQFGPQEDFDRYPRDPARDAGLAADAGADILFTPSAEEMYPSGFKTYVTVEGLSDRYEGVSRPGHFRGVATVVAKLLQIVQPDLAVFGQKDAQQVAVIRRLVQDLHLDVEIVVGQTVREKDGLALSSRNAFLSPAERQAAAVLSSVLRVAETAVAAGERDGRKIAALLSEEIGREPLARLDYAEVVAVENYEPMDRIAAGAVAIVAAKFGATRLIDNLPLLARSQETRQASRVAGGEAGVVRDRDESGATEERTGGIEGVDSW